MKTKKSFVFCDLLKNVGEVIDNCEVRSGNHVARDFLLICLLHSICQDHIRFKGDSIDPDEYEELIEELTHVTSLTHIPGTRCHTTDNVKYCVDHGLLPISTEYFYGPEGEEEGDSLSQCIRRDMFDNAIEIFTLLFGDYEREEEPVTRQRDVNLNLDMILAFNYYSKEIYTCRKWYQMTLKNSHFNNGNHQQPADGVIDIDL